MVKCWIGVQGFNEKGAETRRIKEHVISYRVWVTTPKASWQFLTL